MDALRTHRTGTQLPHLADVERLSPNVIRILGDNPSSFTLQGTNTYLLGRGPLRILLDTGSGVPTWPSRLASVLHAEGATVSICLLSHWHHDHIGGTADLVHLCGNDAEVQVYKNRPDLDPDGLLSKKGVKVGGIEDGQLFEVEGMRLRAVYTPGHAKDHMVFVVVDEAGDDDDAGAMFTGDNVVGHGTVMFEDLTVYLRSLALMAASIGPTARAYPAHGAVLEDGRGTIDMYIRHRQLREEGVLRVLRTGRLDEAGGGEKVAEGSREWEGKELGALLYRYVPESLRGPAEWGLVQVLTKLEGDGKVVRSEEGRWRLVERSVL